MIARRKSRLLAKRSSQNKNQSIIQAENAGSIAKFVVPQVAMPLSVMAVGSSGGAIMALIAKKLSRNRYASD